MGMLTTVGVVVSMDTYGPISDNAQGIAEMSGEFEGRPAEILGGLDAIGNSTKAITKGIAIATAVIAATSLFGSFEEALRGAGFNFIGIRVDRPGRARRAAARRVGRVPVLVARDPRGRAGPPRRSWSRCGTSSATTPGSWIYSEKPDYGARRGHLHQDVAP